MNDERMFLVVFFVVMGCGALIVFWLNAALNRMQGAKRYRLTGSFDGVLVDQSGWER